MYESTVSWETFVRSAGGLFAPERAEPQLSSPEHPPRLQLPTQPANVEIVLQDQLELLGHAAPVTALQRSAATTEACLIRFLRACCYCAFLPAIGCSVGILVCPSLLHEFCAMIRGTVPGEAGTVEQPEIGSPICRCSLGSTSDGWSSGTTTNSSPERPTLDEDSVRHHLGQRVSGDMGSS